MAVAPGPSVTLSPPMEVVEGPVAMAASDNSTAIGNMAMADGVDAIAIGDNAMATGPSTTSVGGETEGPGTTAIVTTVMGDDAHIVAALSAGAEGYLLKETPPDLLHRQLVQLADGIPAISPSIARRIMEHFRFTGPAAEPDGELTAREKEVLTLIARGLRNSDVASALVLAESTVASHIKAIYRKLDIGSRAEASWHATRLGLGQS